MTQAQGSFPTVYLIGDAGYDEFQLGDKSCSIPAGAFFIKVMFETLLNGELTIKPLIEGSTLDVPLQSNSLTQEWFLPVWTARRAMLKHYDKILRVLSYDLAQHSSSSKRIKVTL